MLIIGHRGVMGEAPQNTLPSFQKALEGGLPAIELDVQLTKDGRLAVFHDDDIRKILRGQAKGRIKDYTLSELQKFNANDCFDDDKTYTIPSLEDVLDFVAQKATVNVELKSSKTAVPTAKVLEKYFQKGWGADDFIISSFIHNELGHFKSLMPQLDIALLLDEWQWLKLRGVRRAVELAQKTNAAAVNPGKGFVTQKVVDAAHQAGLKVNVYTIKTPEQYARMEKLGVDGVFVNYLGLEKGFQNA